MNLAEYWATEANRRTATEQYWSVVDETGVPLAGSERLGRDEAIARCWYAWSHYQRWFTPQEVICTVELSPA